ncbi:MAG TPA: type I methionyl aminopeptidase [Patescibacteria group bacterium]|nr:type I methionyl aminopeptidase [Patescibacteria group bacterium]
MAKIPLKSPEEIKVMAEGGEKLGRILDEVLGKIEPGVSTLEIDSWIENRIVEAGGEPSFKRVPRYHWTSCVGLNDEVVHSIPKKEKLIRPGDLLKIDSGMLWRGWNTDLSWTIEVGGKTRFSKFLQAGEKALVMAIEAACPGNRVGHISEAIQRVIEGAGFHPVEVLTGHGIGRKLHEEPLIPGVLKEPLLKTFPLEPGMTLAIEVIYGQGTGEIVLESDGWTISTKDGKIAGLFEKTIAVTESGPLVLTPVRFSEKG